MSFLEVLYFIVPSAIFYASPLILGAIGGVFSERSGVVNIGIEGIMVIGAFVGIVFNLFVADSLGGLTPWAALVAAMLIGAMFSLFLAVAAISFRADQTVTGVALNLLGVAIALFSVKMLFDGKGQTDFIQERFARFDIPLLSDIPCSSCPERALYGLLSFQSQSRGPVLLRRQGTDEMFRRYAYPYCLRTIPNRTTGLLSGRMWLFW